MFYYYMACCFVWIWFLFPITWRQTKNLQKRMRYIVLRLIAAIVMDMCFEIIFEVIRQSSNQYQPIVALMLPALREVYTRVSIPLIQRAAFGDECGAMIYLKYAIHIHYASLLCIVLGSLATESTSWVLIAVDYTYNMWLCFKIIRKQNPRMIEEQIDALQELALCELAEFHTPIGYILALVGASYGPNIAILGNIGNDYWTFYAIKDINLAIRNMAFLFLVDFSSTVASAVILWYACNISLWKALSKLQNEFGKVFCFLLGYLLYLVCIRYII